MYWILLVVIVIALMCFRLWPLWLKKGIWYISFYLLVFLVVTAILRLILWLILYHFGMEFWLFPNYFVDSNDPRDSFLPVYSFEIRDDALDWKSIVFRLLSGAMIVYMGYQFCQDEKNIEDLKDLGKNGLSDLFEYGQEFVVGGNALGDGKEKDASGKNETRKESFAEKYQRELRKDVDDLGADDDEEAPGDEDETQASGIGESENDPEEEGEPETFDDEGEEYVSSQDMFDKEL